MADMNTLLTTIRDALAGDAAIKVWTNATYEKDHKVFVGVDKRNPPGESDCPLVVVAHSEKKSGESAEVIEHQFQVSLEIIDETMVEASSTTTYKESILALITAELTREGKTAEEIATAIALITDSFDDDPTATIESNITEYAGMRRIEEFRQLILACIETALDSYRITKTPTVFGPIEFFPSFMCDMLITIEEETEFGSEFVE